MDEPRDVLLEVNGLRTYFHLDEGVLKAVDGVSLRLGKRKVLGIVGESGCGKTVAALSILRIVPPPGRVEEGQILLNRNGGVVDLARMNPYGDEIRAIRGGEIAMIFQEPMTSLSPVHTIGFQIMESIMLHQKTSRAEARRLATEMLNRVGIPNPGQRVDEYPHRLSGGLRQRATIAMALCCNPSILIADEPTTALDVTVQGQILRLMQDLQRDLGMAIVFITHNLGLIAEVCDEIAVMYLGKIVEYASVEQVFDNPQHPYTKKLLRSIPTVGPRARTRLDSIPGLVPLPINLPEQCGFFERCSDAIRGLCDVNDPPLRTIDGGHQVRCFTAGGC